MVVCSLKRRGDHDAATGLAPPIALSPQEAASSRGRSISIHPDERLLAELRQRQTTPVGRAKLWERTAVEHSLAHLGHWQGERARYVDERTNLSDLRRIAVVHNLHVIARAA
jgi:transposase